MENNNSERFKSEAFLHDSKSNKPDKEFAQKDNLESPSLEISSSILEFLDHERKCLNSAGGDGSDVDIKSILDEINRLSGDTVVSSGEKVCDEAGDRSVEDILKEAERLVKESSETFSELRSSTKSRNIRKDALSIKESRIIGTNNAVEMGDGNNKDKEGGDVSERADSPDNKNSYDESFDTSSDAKSLPDDHLNLDSVQIWRDDERDDRTILGEDLHDGCRRFEPLNLTFVQATGAQSLDGKRLRDACTSPVFPAERNAAEVAALQKSEDRIRDLEERLHAAKLQHNSIAGSFRSLTVEHAELQSKNTGLQVELLRLQDALKSSALQLEKHMEITEQLREANYALQKNLQSERDCKRAVNNQDEQQKRTIQDLQRQVREMERILARKHPDSVSALIVASKHPSVPADDSARKLLEERILQLEDSSKQQSAKSQAILQNVQDKFNSMQVKYEAHISDLESQVFSLQQINMEYQRQKRDTVDGACQTDAASPAKSPGSDKGKRSVSVAVQTNKPAPKTAVTKNVKQNLNNNLSTHKEETHLLATIRGLNQDLTVKEKTLQRLTRELDDCKKTIKKLQKDREVTLKTQGQSKPKEYDPQTFTCSPNQDQDDMSNRALLILQREYHALIEKRLHDLNALQNSHEHELAGLERTIHALHNRIHEKDATILSLKGQIKTKVSALEKRQIEREQTLKALVSKLSNGKLDKDWINM